MSAAWGFRTYSAITDVNQRLTRPNYYQRLHCEGGTPFQIVFHNSKGTNVDHISYLDMAYCEVSLLNIGVYGTATDLKVASFEQCTFMDESHNNESIHQNNSHQKTFPDIIPGLKNVVSLTLTSPGTGNIPIPWELLSYKWLALAELDLQMITLSDQQLDTVRHTLPNLQSLYVKKCNLSSLPTFSWSSALQVLPNNLTRTDFANSHYVGGEGLTLDSQLTRRMISVKENNLQDLSSYHFEGRLDKIVLTSNQIHAIGQDTFANVSNLQGLILNSNHLNTLPNGVFRNLHSLTELDLSSNYIESVSQGHFHELQRLKILNLANNLLLTIRAKTFSDLRSLETLDLSGNSIRKVSDETFGYDMLNTFASVNLNNNNMTNVPTWIFTTRHLRKILLSRNRISFDTFVKALEKQESNVITFANTESASRLDSWYKPLGHKTIDLSNNRFTTLDLNKISDEKKQVFKTILNFFMLVLNENDIDCDCHTYSMYQFFNKHRSEALSKDFSKPRIQKFYYDEWKCSKPENVKGKPIMSLKNDTFVCQKEVEGCPEECVCLQRGVDRSIIVNCSGQNLTSFPEQVPNRTDTLLFSYNNMESLRRTSYFESLKILDVSHNCINTIEDDTVHSLDHITSVKLNNNKMRKMPLGFKNLHKVQLSLSDNHFTCDCHMKWAVKWVFSYRWNITDIDRVVCSVLWSRVPGSQAIYDADPDDFICPNSWEGSTGIGPANSTVACDCPKVSVT